MGEHLFDGGNAMQQELELRGKYYFPDFKAFLGTITMGCDSFSIGLRREESERSIRGALDKIVKLYNIPIAEIEKSPDCER